MALTVDVLDKVAAVTTEAVAVERPPGPDELAVIAYVTLDDKSDSTPFNAKRPV